MDYSGTKWKGLELCLRYYEEIGRPAFEARIPELIPRMAAGLCGEGSECFGRDDEISRDHDWGPGFCIWLTREDFLSFGEEAKKIYHELPGTFCGYRRVDSCPQAAARVGVFSISGFYQGLLGEGWDPQTLEDWYGLPAHGLSAATNGRVFWDGPGAFSRHRQRLLAYYPEEIRDKKLASACFYMAQAGQSNLYRSLKRGEWGAAYLCLSEFVRASLLFVYALNRRYPPFYKWLHPMAEELPRLGNAVHDMVLQVMGKDLREPEEGRRVLSQAENFCAMAGACLCEEAGLVWKSDFLLDLAIALNERIPQEWLRRLPFSMEA